MTHPYIEQFADRFARSEPVERILAAVASGARNVVVTKLKGGAPAALAVALHRGRTAPTVLLTSSPDKAETLADGAAFFGGSPSLFPAIETLPFETSEPALHIASARSEVLAALCDGAGPAPLIVAPADALMFRVPPREALRGMRLRVEWGQAADIDELARRLVAMGYARESMVESPGEFSVRGTIVDVWPAEADTPRRLDFFGDEIESIRTFDPATQRSLPLDREIEALDILPRANLAGPMDLLAEGRRLASFLDLLPPETLFVLDGPSRIDQRLQYFEEVARRHWDDVRATHAAATDESERNFFVERGVEPGAWVLGRREARDAIAAGRRVSLVDLSLEADEFGGEAVEVPVGAQSFESVPSEHERFLELIEDKRLGGFSVVVVCDNAGQASRFDELLAERQVSAVSLDLPPKPGEEGAPRHRAVATGDVALVVGDLGEGFIFPAAKLLVVTDREIFGRYKRRRVHRRAYRGKKFRDPTEISRGDFVVHADHGIGVFEGVRRQEVEGRVCEFLEISYQESDKLLVPIEKLHLVQKYSGADGKAPVPDKLGKKGGWARRRQKTREAVRKMAGELLELYARRETAEGFAYGPDSIWQREFEASFLYRETPDQQKAIDETKSDMMRPKPMDRLVCGDVGYGKTEVAIRAAFKALDGKRQVAILCPTTLLCRQHYDTFRERLADYPFKIAAMSRFETASEQKETLRKLAEGEVDLVVGTHRLLSKDVKFKDLGLLVVDEEQRFGVAQKEKIKSMRTSVDILTLTATPIPRTLHMALARLRDLSIIQTPPADRLPIKTRTIHFEKEQIEEAILRELNRGGQVFFIHNRVESIDDVARTIREIVPNAKVAVGHGRMDEDELEVVMGDFVAGKHDVLVATTIVENGIDIPNVNTILVNRADAMGLAQLYQIRGRVGRDVRQAYAYLILPKGKPITDTAVKRLSALEEFTELGMGFTIAMRDMEIRGAGNLLGKEQHGAICDVGFDLYCKLLEEAVNEARGDAPPEETWPTEIKWPVDQWLPEAYVPIESQRIRLYKELAAARTTERVREVREELRDLYGELPAEAANLIHAFVLKTAVAPWKVDAVKPIGGSTVRFSCKHDARAFGRALHRASKTAEWIEGVELRGDAVLLKTDYDEDNERPDLLLRDVAELATSLPAPEPPAA